MKQIQMLLLGALGFGVFQVKSQDLVDTHRSFLTAGVNISIPKKHSLKLWGGLSTEQHIQMTMITPNIRVNKWLSFSPSYTFLDVPRRTETDFREHHLNLMATLSLPLEKRGKWIFQNRNAYYLRAIEQGETTSFYKGRIGVVHQTKLFKKPLNAFVYNEIYLSLQNGHITRKRFYAGAELKLFDWLTPQATYIYQLNEGNTQRDHLFLVGMIVPLENFGFFKSKKAY